MNMQRTEEILDTNQKHLVAFRSNPALFEVEYIFKSDGRADQDI